MPSGVITGKDVTACTVGAKAFVGHGRTWRLSASVNEADHTGPLDDDAYATIMNKRWTLTIEAFTLSATGADGADIVGTQVAVSGNAWDGRTMSGTFNVTGCEVNNGEAGTQTVTAMSVGAVTFA